MRRWWRGTGLVAERSLVENLRSRSFKIVTGLLLLLSVAGVVAPQVFGDEDPTYTLATVGKAPPDLVAAVRRRGKGGGLRGRVRRTHRTPSPFKPPCATVTPRRDWPVTSSTATPRGRGPSPSWSRRSW